MADPREADLLASVLAAPDDDAPRLVYADWLLERGDPRGEFIALQCRAAALPDGAARWALESNTKALLERHDEDWFGAIRRICPDVALEIRRGFPEGISCTGDVRSLIECAPELFARAPIGRLWLHAESEWYEPSNEFVSPHFRVGSLSGCALDRLSALPELVRIHDLGVVSSDDGAVTLFDSPYLTGVRSLTLCGCASAELVKAALRSLALDSLALDSSPATDEAVAVLVDAEMPTLIRLSLRCEPISPYPNRPGPTTRGVAALADRRGLPRLREVMVWDHPLNYGQVRSWLGDATAERFAAAPRTAELSALGLRCPVGIQGVRALTESPNTDTLTVDLELDWLSDECLLLLAYASRPRAIRFWGGSKTHVEVGELRAMFNARATFPHYDEPLP